MLAGHHSDKCFLNDKLYQVWSTYILINQENEMFNLSVFCTSLQTMGKIIKTVN